MRKGPMEKNGKPPQLTWQLKSRPFTELTHHSMILHSTSKKG